MAEDYWPLAQTLLEKIAQREEWGYDFSLFDIAAELGLSRQTVSRQARALFDDGYITGAAVETFDTEWDLFNPRLRPKGMRQVGEWPSEDAYGELLKVLDRRLAEAEDGSEEKSRLQKFREGVVGMGRDIAVGVLTEWAKRGGPF